MSEEKLVRLQVPIRKYVADEIAAHAKEMGWSVNWLCTSLLEFMGQEHKLFLEWYAMALFGKSYGAVKRLMSGKRRRKKDSLEEVRLQINIPEKLSTEIEALAENGRETPVRMAGKLLEAGIHHHEPFMDFLGTKWGKKTAGAVRGRGGSSSSTNEKLMPCMM